MEQLLQLSTNSYFVGGIFFVTLVLLHVFFVVKYPLSASQWKLAEYVWVLLALVSVVGIFEEARILRSMQTVATSGEVAERKLAALENWFDVYGLHACENDGEVNKEPQLCDWVTAKNSDVQLVVANEEFPAGIPSNLLLGLDDIESGLAEADRKIIRDHLSGYLSARKNYIAAVKGSEYTSFSFLLISLAPLMFALAVALKFAKVSGEYRLLRK